jgi:hypothetical protein
MYLRAIFCTFQISVDFYFVPVGGRGGGRGGAGEGERARERGIECIPWRKMEQPYSPNLSDLAECVILCTSWLPSPGKVYCRAVNI